MHQNRLDVKTWLNTCFVTWLQVCRKVLLEANALPTLLHHTQQALAPLGAGQGASTAGGEAPKIEADDLELVLEVLERLAADAALMADQQAEGEGPTSKVGFSVF